MTPVVTHRSWKSISTYPIFIYYSPDKERLAQTYIIKTVIAKFTCHVMVQLHYLRYMALRWKEHR